MARFQKMLGGIEIGANGFVKNLVVENLAADPANLEAGKFWFDTAAKAYKACHTDADGNVIVKSFGTLEELQAFITLLASQTAGEGAANVGYAGHDGANAKFLMPAGTLEASLDSLTDAIDADRLVIENNLNDTQAAVADMQAEIDAVEAGAGLGEDGAYTAKADANYISAATSLADADNKLDVQSKVNADAIAQEVSDRQAAVTQLTSDVAGTYLDKVTASEQVVNAPITMNSDLVVKGNITFNGGTITEVDTEQLKISDNVITLNSDVPADVAPTENAGLEIGRGTEGVMPFLQWDEANDVATVVSGKDSDGNWVMLPIATGGDAAALQAEVDTIESAAGLGADGSYTADSAANYISGATTLFNADQLLDAQVKTNADAIAQLSSDSSSTSDAIQAELDAAEAGAGLGEDGSYVADTSANYINNATSIDDATHRLDAQVYVNTNAIANLDNSQTNALNDLKTALDATRFTYVSSAAATSFAITHSLNSEFVDVQVWVLDTTDNKYYNDSVVVSITDANSVQVDLTSAADIKVVISAIDKAFA